MMPTSHNLAKCDFGQATVTYLGKIVGRGQVKPVHSKVEAILSFPAPVSRRELRRQGITEAFVKTSLLLRLRSPIC